MRNAEELIARDLACVWHPCSQMRDYETFPPLPVVGARGCRLQLADGREVLDAISSWWCKSLGHGHPAIVRAIQEQAARFEHVILANTTNELLVGFCERLLALANPPGQRHFTKVLFAGDGSSGMEIAVKLALHWQRLQGQGQRTRYAVLANGYHGETVGALSISDLGLYADPYRPLLFPSLVLDGLPYRQGPEDPRWASAEAEWPALAAQLAAQAETLAALVYEPLLQAAGGMRVYSPDLLTRLCRWARAHGVLCVADEIASGIGRCGAWLASQLAADALPDIAVLSKGLTGGSLPLTVVLTTERIYEAFLGSWESRRAFLHSHTYCGNALALAAADAALRAIAEEGLCERARTVGARLRAKLAARAHPRLSAVRGLGMVAAVDLLGCAPQARTGWQVYRAAVARGALLRPLADTLYLFPPLNAPWDELERMLDILIASVDAVLGRS
ncbi:MAG: adenosylmethionine--8-amino-7-oxononanoate transaminase [Planctomycetes bacterium]|nr:adenosylmethionine--8-amino-7-oxononanoate transaminase [Planctomycetota bacterium]